jgi:hypothetical protein
MVKNEHPMILETVLLFSCAWKVYLYFIKHLMYLASTCKFLCTELRNTAQAGTIYLCCYPRLFSIAIVGLNFLKEKREKQ